MGSKLRTRKIRENPPEEGENLAFHAEHFWACHTFLLQDKWGTQNFLWAGLF